MSSGQNDRYETKPMEAHFPLFVDDVVFRASMAKLVEPLRATTGPSMESG